MRGITRQDVINGYASTSCEDCRGTGLFVVPDGVVGVIYHYPENPCPEKDYPCVACKGKGKILVNV
jgi:hypothetical protein